MRRSSQVLLGRWKREQQIAIVGVGAILCLFFGAKTAAWANNPVVLPPEAMEAGGIPGIPKVISFTRGTNKTTVNMQWWGVVGPYQVEVKGAFAPGQSWRTYGSPTYATSATITTSSNKQFFRISAPAPAISGVTNVCISCHAAYFNAWTNTEHAVAYSVIATQSAATIVSCQPCHTVAMGLPTGFTSAAATPQLTGVQCENCHGPAGDHASDPFNVAPPIVSRSAEVCGGCHTGPYPTYDEWKLTPHATVISDLITNFAKGDTNRMNDCGPCHSGAVRLNMVKAALNPKLPMVFPRGDEAAAVAVDCVVCHDPHNDYYDPQLRYPRASTNFYSYDTTKTFTSQYNTNINVCGQCHNARGAAWTDTSRPPHHSPQYNMLLGNVGELTTGLPPSQPAPHGLRVTNQCAYCHMPARPNQGPGHPAVTGHAFAVTSYEVCRVCHPGGDPAGLARLANTVVSNQIQQVKGLLDTWGQTRAPAPLRVAYGARSWEYTNPGDLSNPPGVTNGGPTTAQQTLIPASIQKARFNLYLVRYDGSYGIHNPWFATTLLEAAQIWVESAFSP